MFNWLTPQTFSRGIYSGQKLEKFFESQKAIQWMLNTHTRNGQHNTHKSCLFGAFDFSNLFKKYLVQLNNNFVYRFWPEFYFVCLCDANRSCTLQDMQNKLRLFMCVWSLLPSLLLYTLFLSKVLIWQWRIERCKYL